MNMEKTYNKKRSMFLEGKISEEEWKQYCKEVLFEKIEENKSLFQRMKFR